MRPGLRISGYVFVVLAAALLVAGCSAFRTEPFAPVAPFGTPPATMGELAARVEKYQPPIETLHAQLKAIAQGGNVGGKQNLRIPLYYRSPDNIAVQVSRSLVGTLFRIYKRGDEVAYFDTRNSQFFRGTIQELEAYPEALEGVQPMDIVRALLVSQEMGGLLRNMPPGAKLEIKSPYWALSNPGQARETEAPGITPPRPPRGEVFLIRPSDGLVQEAFIYEGSTQKAHIIYSRYGSFEGSLLPSRFELFFPETGLRIRAEVETARPNADVPMTRFPLEPPRDFRGQVLPLATYLEWVEQQKQ